MNLQLCTKYHDYWIPCCQSKIWSTNWSTIFFPFWVILGSFFYLFTPTTGYKINFFRNKKKQTLQYVKFRLMYHRLWLLDVMVDTYHRWCVICHFGPYILPFYTCQWVVKLNLFKNLINICRDFQFTPAQQTLITEYLVGNWLLLMQIILEFGSIWVILGFKNHLFKKCEQRNKNY